MHTSTFSIHPIVHMTLFVVPGASTEYPACTAALTPLTSCTTPKWPLEHARTRACMCVCAQLPWRNWSWPVCAACSTCSTYSPRFLCFIGGACFTAPLSAALSSLPGEQGCLLCVICHCQPGVKKLILTTEH